jgi:hypothetical protein
MVAMVCVIVVRQTMQAYRTHGVTYEPETIEKRNMTWEGMVYRQLPIMEQAELVERYLVACAEPGCGFRREVSGGKWPAIGRVTEHHINGENDHHMVVTDCSSEKGTTAVFRRQDETRDDETPELVTDGGVEVDSPDSSANIGTEAGADDGDAKAGENAESGESVESAEDTGVDIPGDLPDHEWSWGDPHEIGLLGLTCIEPEVAEQHGLIWLGGSRDCSLKPGEAAIALDGIDEYLAEHADRELDVPAYYSRFDEFDVYFGAPTAKHGNAVAVGINSRRLEAAIRFVTGGGRYRSADLTVTGCGAMPAVVEYDGLAAVVSPTQFRDIPDDVSPETWEVSADRSASVGGPTDAQVEASGFEFGRRFDVLESDATVRHGLERVLGFAEGVGVSIVGYQGLRSGKHVFEQANGRDVFLRGKDLRRAGSVPTDAEDVQGTYEVETEFGESYEADWSDVGYEVGDEFDDWYCEGTGIVMGYRVRYEDPRTSSRVSMSGKITVDGAYYVLQFVDNRAEGLKHRDEDKYSYDSLKVRTEDKRLEEFDPRNEEYQPFQV